MSATLTEKDEARNVLDVTKDVRDEFNIPNGYQSIFTFKNAGKNVKPLDQALKEIQEAMAGAAELMGVETEDDVVALVKESRAEIYANLS